MKKTDPTQFDHYAHYPMCGWCYNAWDLVYARTRSSVSPMRWLEFCRWGGCDPDIWDMIDEGTGWPHGWSIDAHNVPIAYQADSKIVLDIPDYDNRVFHMRKDNGPSAPWRTVNQRLLKLSQKHVDPDAPVSLDKAFEEGPLPAPKPKRQRQPKVTVPAVQADDEDYEDLFD